MDPSAPLHLEMRSITKAFPAVVANRDVSLSVRRGTIHAVIGENGAGKSTLMNVLYGRYRPDAGQILLDGREVQIGSPSEAIQLGIGLVAQHTTLIPALTLLENIILGAEPTKHGILRTADSVARVKDICDRLAIEIPVNAAAGDVSIAVQQKTEIIKALYRGARLIIFDEPTAMLAAQEADALFALMHAYVDGGNTALLITHKLKEVADHADYVTVLRAGREVGSGAAEEIDSDTMLALIIGKREATDLTLSERDQTPSPAARPILEVRGLSCHGRGSMLREVSLTVHAGEIVGVAGVDGSGQRELAESIVGLRPSRSESLRLDGKEISGFSAAGRLSRGLAFIPEDRQREGLILDFNIAENLLLGRQRDRRFGGGTPLRPLWIQEIGRQAIQNFRIAATSERSPARGLSGGNQQKLLVARALQGTPRLLVAMQPTRGLDVEASSATFREIRARTAQGMGVLLFSLDLDELIASSDRIAVMYNGRIAGIIQRAEATPEAIGRMMMSGST